MLIKINTGPGRLHLTKSFEILTSIQSGLNFGLITGWIPGQKTSWMVSTLGKVYGHKNMAYGMQQRSKMKEIGLTESLWAPDFFLHFLFLLQRRLGLLSKDLAAYLGWSVYAYSSSFRYGDADIIHVRSGAGGRWLKKFKGKKRIIVDHSIAHPKYFDDNLNELVSQHNLEVFNSMNSKFWRMVLRDCEIADFILVNSDFVKQTFLDNGFAEERIIVNYLGVRQDFYGLKDSYVIKANLKLLYVGGVVLRKGVLDLIEMMNILARDLDIEVDLTLIGTNDEILKDYSKNENMSFLGHLPQDELAMYLSNSDIFIFPSLGEGCAVSLMEAWAAGIPVICTRESGLPAIHKKDALFVKTRSPEELANSVKELVFNYGLRAELGNEAKRSFASQYTWDRYAQDLIDIYKIQDE